MYCKVQCVTVIRENQPAINTQFIPRGNLELLRFHHFPESVIRETFALLFEFNLFFLSNFIFKGELFNSRQSSNRSAGIFVVYEIYLFDFTCRSE